MSKQTSTQIPLRPKPTKPSSCQIYLIRVLSCFTLCAGIAYVCHRWLFFIYGICSTSAKWWGLPFLLTDTLLLMAPIFSLFTIWNPKFNDDKNLFEMMPTSSFPMVDVLVPCYNEPVRIVQEVLEAASKMNYPISKLNVYLLDDGNSKEMKDMTEMLNTYNEGKAAKIHYIARHKPEGVPHHAKAGNMNNALFNGNLEGTFITVFDCDMIPTPQYLQTIIPHFFEWNADHQKWAVDEKMSLIQTPQDFYNTPKSDPLGQRYAFFYDFSLPGWNGHGVVPCCGTNMTMRRKHLMNIGGFATLSVTEDIITSMRLTASGYKTTYVADHLTFGLAPTSLDAYYKQRSRWALGSIQILLREPPYRKQGLNLAEKILYTWQCSQYLMSIPFLLILLCPFAYYTEPDILLSGAPIWLWLQYFLPYYFGMLSTNLVAASNVGALYVVRGSEEFFSNTFINIEAALKAALNIDTGFAVTQKDGKDTFQIRDLIYCSPHIVYILLTFLLTFDFIMGAVKGNTVPETIDLAYIASCLVMFGGLISNCWNLSAHIRFAFYKDPQISFEDFSINAIKEQIEEEEASEKSPLLPTTYSDSKGDSAVTEPAAVDTSAKFESNYVSGQDKCKYAEVKQDDVPNALPVAVAIADEQ